ncbi:cupin-like domain-containing protein [Runella sp.]|uniref:cupin-like domain-containing protein n=1 Tax=Runella sp. TaxID=1960881 RepID=UPI003D126B7E
MQIQKVGDISHKEFMREFHDPGIPVVFKNASKAWKANGLFTPDYFREKFGDRKTGVNGKDFTMTELLDLIENSTPETPAPYPCIYNVAHQLPEIEELISPLGMNYAVPNWFESSIFPKKLIGSETELFLGGPGGKYQTLHIDFYHTNAWVTQLYGDKNFIIFPRGQDKYLYPNAKNKWISDVNWHSPDYEKHPEFKHATPVIVTVKQGETIFIPEGLWHTAEALSTSISIIFDQINAKNFDSWRNDVWEEKKEGNKMKALAIFMYVSMAKKYCQARDLFRVKK